MTLLACASPAPDGTLVAEVGGRRILETPDGFVSVLPGGTWHEADTLDALPGVGFEQGFLWSGTEGQRLDPVQWTEEDLDCVEMRAMAPHGVLWGNACWPADAEEALPVVVWMARNGGGQSDHTDAARALAGQGAFVLSYDRRGLGNSRLWEPTEVSLESHAADFDDWTPFLEQHPMADADDVRLFGHGLGGRVARLRPEPSVTVSGPGDDRVAHPDLDAREPWRAGDDARGLTPVSIASLGAALQAL